MLINNVEYLFNFNKLLNTQIFDWIERPELHFKVGKLGKLDRDNLYLYARFPFSASYVPLPRNCIDESNS